MSTTTNIGLEILTEGQANKEASISEAHQQLDALVQAAVISRATTAAPSGSPGPSEGDVYLIPNGSPAASGDWAGYDGYIAHYRNSAWTFIAPKEGWRLYVKDEDVLIIYDGSSWSTIGGSITLQEADGSPSVSGVDTIVVTNGKLTDDGGGQATLDLSGGAGSIAGFQGIWEQIDRQEFSAVSSVTVGGSQTPEDYDRYLLLLNDVMVSTDGATISGYASTDGGSTTVTSNSRAGAYYRSNNTSGAFGGEGASVMLSAGAIDTGASNRPVNIEATIEAPGSSNFKNFREWHIEADNGSGANMKGQIVHGRVGTTSAIDSFVFNIDAGTMSGTAILIGLKKSETSGRVVDDSSTARTLSDDDNNRILHFNGSASPATITIPDTLSKGFETRVVNRTGGNITISAGGSPAVILVGDATISNNQTAEILMVSTTVAVISAL